MGQTVSVSSTVSAITIFPGQQNVAVPVSVTGNVPGPVAVTLTGLPSGISVAPLTLLPGASGTLLLSASPAAGQEGFTSMLLIGVPTSWTASAKIVAASGLVQATVLWR